ncbi:MAG: 2-isopropylmalate synthase [Bacteroidales bacterium]|nr:2-isopropylmalate synthase [Candidatus Physcocola equi]
MGKESTERLRYSIEIMDTTLRDGEQTSGVSFVPHEKLILCRTLLQEVGVDRIEVASARVSDGEKEAVKKICQWAEKEGLLNRIEVLGFVDGHASLDWIHDTGCKNINLLTKGSLLHCTQQLKKTPEEHLAGIKDSIAYAHQLGIDVNIYLEDWSNGIKNSPDYVFFMMDNLRDCGIKHFMLPDTLGILTPDNAKEGVKLMTDRYPDLKFDFHAHNDYDLAVANAMAAVSAGATGLHTTINGLGERAGNAPLASVQAALHDHYNAATNIKEEKLTEVSHLVESYCGIAIPPNKPVVGDSVFTQVAGVHADGDNKAGLYMNNLLPERFGRKREYALGKNSGKANILRNLEELGLALTPEQTKAVTQRVIELGDKKELVTPEDLPYIVADVVKHSANDDRVKLDSYLVSTSYGLKPLASVRVEINGVCYEETATGDGQYDAFVRAVRHIYREKLNRKFPWLTNYAVSIPPGGRTDALVQTSISWTFEGKSYRTRGLDADQMEAAIKATIKMLNLIEDLYDQASEQTKED